MSHRNGRIKLQHNRGRTRKQRWYGANWIRQDRRLAIYLRDGFKCVYCCASALLDAVRLTLDPIKTVDQGGGNATRNLITACSHCNSSRGDRSVREFAAGVAAYVDNGVTPIEIIMRIKFQRRQPIDRPAARELITKFGSAVKAIPNARPLRDDPF
jgi:hypothetical protein